MINAVIIEDETLVAKGLVDLINKADATINIVKVLGSLKSSIAYFKSNPEPDLLFMDIQLSDGVSFELLKEVKINCPIIFTTAYNEYAIRAFKLNSIDYLLKPVDKEELKLAIDKFKQHRYLDNQLLNEQLKSLIKHISLPNETKAYKERFMVHSGKSVLIINHDKIAYFIKEVLIYLVTKDNQKFITDFQTMEEIEELVNPATFFRANRQVIFKSDVVESFKSDSYGKLIVKLIAPVNKTVDVSREKAQALKKWLQ
ncbi:LytR/AlgR family response regulator transcription factor [Mariniflexile gromovii]|uniref:Response regulator transcription factor n=1 Tax=Mariniflexile gromovii TaxID=362523 RepID=A0ABS4BQ06_9FLAO|nr:LytTR family DNA-binding domain-containing protein [Mariniflexile gromovii]MBP0902670.1 response regulator transcription factor [Mariniflexile gromovii]